MNRYDDRARLVFHFAREEGSRLGHAMFGPEHLLLGLMREGGAVSVLLGEFGATLESVRRQVEEMVGRGDGLRKNEAAAVTPRARRVMELAGSEARSLGSKAISTEHILLGIIREGDGVGYRILETLVKDVDTIRWRILSTAEQKQVEPGNWLEQVDRIESYLNALEQNLSELRWELARLRQAAPPPGYDAPERQVSPSIFYSAAPSADGRDHAVTKGRLARLESLGFRTYCALRDSGDWGAAELEPAHRLKLTFGLIDQSDLILLDLSEQNLTLGACAGYAYAQKKPVVTLVEGSELPETLHVFAQTFLYTNEDEVQAFFSSLVRG